MSRRGRRGASAPRGCSTTSKFDILTRDYSRSDRTLVKSRTRVSSRRGRSGQEFRAAATLILMWTILNAAASLNVSTEQITPHDKRLYRASGCYEWSGRINWLFSRRAYQRVIRAETERGLFLAGHTGRRPGRDKRHLSARVIRVTI